MADDPLTRFTNKFRPKQSPEAPTPQPKLPASLVQAADTRQVYDAFDNKVRTMNVEIRCHRTEISYSVPLAHIGTIQFNFVKGDRLFFTGGGYAFDIQGKHLQGILLALNLHTIGFIQDYHPSFFLPPDPKDPTAPFVERIEVVVLRPEPKRKDAEQRRDQPKPA